MHRRVAVSGGRAHIEVRGADDPDRAQMTQELRGALARLEGVDWAEVDAVLGRAVIMFDPEAIELDDLVSTIEDVEDAHDASAERFPHDRPDHPADTEPITRHVAALVADVAGLGVATVGQALRLDRLPAEVPGVISLLDSQPRVRRFLEDRFGRPATDVAVASTSALANALGQGPLGLLVDMSLRTSLIAEQQARRAAWERREPELVEGPHSVRHRALDLPPRTRPAAEGTDREVRRRRLGGLVGRRRGDAGAHPRAAARRGPVVHRRPEGGDAGSRVVRRTAREQRCRATTCWSWTLRSSGDSIAPTPCSSTPGWPAPAAGRSSRSSPSRRAPTR